MFGIRDHGVNKTGETTPRKSGGGNTPKSVAEFLERISMKIVPENKN